MGSVKAFDVLDSSGTHYCVLAINLISAYDKFRAWERKQMQVSDKDSDEIEDIQSISPIGDLVP